MLKKIIIIGVIVLAAGGASVYFALTGGGQVDVNQQIRDTNQEGNATQVLQNTRATMPNGGLNPQGGAPTPEPPAPPLQPETASTSDATSTPATDKGEAGDLPQGETPEGVDTGVQDTTAE
jgi:hypothetical protein